jgi:WD40 repeat protein
MAGEGGLIPGGERIWEAESIRIDGHAEYVARVRFSPDGKCIASCSNGGTVRIWDATTGALRTTLRHGASPVWGLAFSPDGSHLAPGSKDRTVVLWRLSDAALVARWAGHITEITAVAFSPDGALLASAGGAPDLVEIEPGVMTDPVPRPKAEVIVRSVKTGEIRFRFGGGEVISLAFQPDGRALSVGDLGGHLRVLGIRTGEVRTGIQAHADPVGDVRYSPGGKQLLTTGGREICCWNAASLERAWNLERREGQIHDSALSPDGLLIAVAGERNPRAYRRKGPGPGEILLVDSATRTTRASVEPFHHPVTSVDFSADGKKLAAAGSRGSIKVCEVSRLLELYKP